MYGCHFRQGCWLGRCTIEGLIQGGVCVSEDIQEDPAAPRRVRKANDDQDRWATFTHLSHSAVSATQCITWSNGSEFKAFSSAQEDDAFGAACHLFRGSSERHTWGLLAVQCRAEPKRWDADNPPETSFLQTDVKSSRRSGNGKTRSMPLKRLARLHESTLLSFLGHVKPLFMHRILWGHWNRGQ